MFRTVPLSIIRSFSLHTAMVYVIQCQTPRNGQRDCPKHVEFYSKNKFEKLVHLVGFIIRIIKYHVKLFFLFLSGSLQMSLYLLLGFCLTVCSHRRFCPVTGVTGLQCLISHDLCLTEDDLASLIASRREILNAGRFRRLYPTASGSRYTGYLQELQALMLQDSKNIFQPVNSLFR